MGLRDLWRLFKAFEGLFELEKKQDRLIQELTASNLAFERRISRLETQFDMLAGEAKSAARAGASDAMQGVLLSIGERLAVVEAALDLRRASPSPAVSPKRPRTPRR